MKAIRRGESFKFPDDEKTYVFLSIEFPSGEPVITYLDNFKQQVRSGFYISDLIR
jgi:hypothetical protein